MKIYTLNKIVAPLDPNAWENEPNPARWRQHMDNVPTPYGTIHQKQNPKEIENMYHGVHLTSNENLAALYALNKSSEEDPPVIVEIDPIWHNKKKDVDANIEYNKITAYIDGIKDGLLKILKGGGRLINQKEKILDFLDNQASFYTMENEGTTVVDIIQHAEEAYPPMVIYNHLKDLSPQRFIKEVNLLLKGKLSDDLLIKSVQQYRISEGVPSERVKAIYKLQYIDPNMDVNEQYYDEDEEDEEDEEEDRYMPDYDDIYNGSWSTRETLYKNNQQYLEGFSSDESVWHGTSLSRAKQAFPDLIGNVSASSKNTMKKEAQVWKYKPKYSDEPEEIDEKMEFEDKVEKFYQLEYKLHMLNTRPFKGMPARKNNIIKKTEEVLNNICNVILDDLIVVYTEWLKNHAILNATDWSRNRIEITEESGGDIFESIVSELYTNFASHSRYDQKKAEDLLEEQIKEEIDNLPQLTNIIRMHFLELRKQDLQDMGLEDFNDTYNTNYLTVEEAEQGIQNRDTPHDLIHEFFGIYGMEDLKHILANNPSIVEEIYSNIVFKAWMNNWGPQGIVQTRETLEKIFELMKNSYNGSIKDKCAAISAGLNAAHQTGDMTDYMEGGDVKATLQSMTDGIFIEGANKELREIGVQI